MEPAFAPVGRVVRLHGLKGDVVVQPAGDVPFAFSVGQHVWFVPPPTGAPREGAISALRDTAKGQVMHVTGVETPEAAHALVGKSVAVRSADAPEGWDDEDPDAVGLLVVDEERGELGVVEEVIITGANDVWVVRGDAFGEVLLPVIDDVIVDFDEQTGTVTVRLLPGLIEGE